MERGAYDEFSTKIYFKNDGIFLGSVISTFSLLERIDFSGVSGRSSVGVLVGEKGSAIDK